jgi:hypothetical protein
MNQIPLEDLEQGRQYIGEGRFSGKPCVAMWDGARFVGLGYSWGSYQVDTAEYGDRGFSPYQSVVFTRTE